MNELELDQCLRAHPITRRYFKGVFARDELFSHPGCIVNTLYVINTDVRQNPGEHWVFTWWSEQSNIPFYFDRYGIAPLHFEIESFLLSASVTYSYNGVQLQDVNSTVCGHYVAYIASQLCAGYEIEDIRRRRFTPHNYQLNDALILSLFRKEFGYPVRIYKEPSSSFTPMSCRSCCSSLFN